jgi:phenylpropionate dioxygenase-like ring-hydroxylating dioxygenase large terminal subunit
MRSPLPPKAYIDQAWFERERELLLTPLWQFIGLKTMLEKHNAFITRTIFGIPVVVQNFDGALQAFENTCLHRHNPIQSAPQGVRPLVCAYHGWGYDRDGAPANIPFEATLYRFDQTERACLHLRRFALECVGNLVFVNLSADPMPLKRQFGAAMLATLAASSLSYDSEGIMTTNHARFNWKLVYENLRDAHHPRYLHARTLNQSVTFNAAVDEAAVEGVRNMARDGTGAPARALALLRAFSGGGRDAPMEKAAPEAWHQHVERYRDQDWYYNWLVYPNLHIASGNGGYSFTIEHHLPVGPDRTDIIVYFMTAKKRQPYASSPAVLLGLMQGTDSILREDVGVLEDIQRTLHAGSRPAHLGDYETTNAGIALWYMEVMVGKIAL